MSANSSNEPTAPVLEDDHSCCENCGAEKKDHNKQFCIKCGYYPSLGVCVELEEYDRVDEQEEQEGEQQATPADKPWIAFFKAMPLWVWVLLGGIACAFVLAIIGRLATPAGSLGRTIWGVAQFVVGGGAFFFAHCYAYFLAAVDDSNVGMLDMLMRLISIWNNRFRELPATLGHVMTACTGLAAAFFALVLVGIPYGFLMDWGIREKADTNLVQAITNAATTGKSAEDGEKDLTGAIQKFASSEKKEVKEPVPEKKITQSIDCVIVGYMPVQEPGTTEVNEDDFESIIVAALLEGQLRVVGKVRRGFTTKARNELNEQLKKIRRTSPFVPCSDQGLWVDPRLTCRILFQDWGAKNTLQNPEFAELLAEL